ncbi:MAG: hypothetical protein GF329_01335 [Candidatus Lokiarchaeota archaeon]|nr:hypothetical protein [Candidatus Lokiarchaeota archaeon]
MIANILDGNIIYREDKSIKVKDFSPFSVMEASDFSYVIELDDKIIQFRNGCFEINRLPKRNKRFGLGIRR